MISLVTRVSARTGVRGRRSGPKGFNCCDRCGVPLGRHPETPWRYHGTCQECGAVQIWARPSESSAADTPSSQPPVKHRRPSGSGSPIPSENRGQQPVARRRQAGFDCCERCGRPLPAHPTQTWRFDGTCPGCGHVQIWAAREVRQEWVTPEPAPPVRRPSPTAARLTAVHQAATIAGLVEAPSATVVDVQEPATVVVDETPPAVVVLDGEPSASPWSSEETPVQAVRASRHHRPRHRAATLRTRFLLLMTVGFGTPPR